MPALCMKLRRARQYWPTIGEHDMSEQQAVERKGTWRLKDGVNRIWRIGRPMAGIPTVDDYRLEEASVPQPGEGQLLIRNIYIAIAPGIRPIMPYAGFEPEVSNQPSKGRVDASDDEILMSHMTVGDRMRSGMVPSMSPHTGGNVGRVIESRHPGFKAGDYVFGGRFWQDFEVVDGDATLRVDPEDLPIEANLGMVGLSAFTGWVGYRRFCEAKPGETMVISAAAGAVGMMVIQMAKAEGLQVIGIASGAEKCRFVTEELGADACIDRLTADVGAELDRLAPKGIDIYFDNVAGNLMTPVFDRLKPFGRLIVCGMAAEYNGFEQSSISTGMILGKRLRIQGFVVTDYESENDAFRADVSKMWREGKITYKHHMYNGLESAPDALAASLSGAYAGGKIIVQVSEDDSKA
ncbi:NADP-dependent oxidoreductase [Sphingomonadales bacterium 56]|nr:NADP-dependent oxidoreductase [Sphingomonadales bacterium 56]MBY2958484.1 NADP-dependent oxidoreductase [Sphingomonadales bacterium 58]CAD7337146.1 NADPH-dependent curcumin reductase [Sphingobium sp. S6]CAD7337203.1 NADPH-dependent curcumin reductase [Sphingobium sp. S8]